MGRVERRLPARAGGAHARGVQLETKSETAGAPAAERELFWNFWADMPPPQPPPLRWLARYTSPADAVKQISGWRPSKIVKAVKAPFKAPQASPVNPQTHSPHAVPGHAAPTTMPPIWFACGETTMTASEEVVAAERSDAGGKLQ